MNLKKLGVVELSAQEVQETEGGFFLEILCGILAGMLFDAIFNP